MLASQLNSEESRALISAVDRMREILHDEKINLPEIVVVGDQSVGKSSVLEAICGIQLPRAQNICTRCPLELRMKSTNDDEYAVIRSSKSSETNGKRINDLNQIADEVTRLTNEIAGKGANVSSDPIYLTVYKRNLPYDLTLIDLPGITRNPLPGQAKNIHEQILNLINKYIEPKTAVVLHVVPASVDFTTSESLKLAKEFDPEGERQLIAVSKIDKYDKGIAEKLLGEGAGTMKLQLGCVAVLNRNQDEIDNNISFEEMKEREKQFFIKHRAAFDLLPDTYKGVDQLVKKLAIIQNDRIRSTFPETVNKLREQLRLKQQELYNIPPTLNTEHECWARFQSMINQFRDKIHAKVNGDYDLKSRNKTNEIDITNLTKSKSISNVVKTDDRIAYHLYKFQKQFQQDIVHKFSNFFSTEYLKHVIKAIDDSTGVSLPNFPSFQIIEYLYHEELEKLPPICFLLLRTMCNYIRENLLNLVSQVFDNEYPRLIHRLNEVIREQITQAEQQAKIRIEEVLDMEYRLFTMNDEYMGMVDKVTTELNDAAQNKDNKSIPSKTPNNPPPAQPTASSSTIFSFASNIFSSSFSGTTDPIIQSKEARAAPAIQIALDSYCKIVQKRLVDSVCQVCYYQFVTRCCLILDQKLTVAVSSADLVRFMKEPAERAVRREKLSHTVKAYAEALKVGQEFL